MAKKKKGAVKGKDARGYGQASAPPSSDHHPQHQQQRQVPHPEPPSTSSSSAADPQQAQMPPEEQEKQPRRTTTTVRGPMMNPSSVVAAAAAPTPAAPNKVVQVSFKTHDGLLQLLGQLAKQENSDDNSNNDWTSSFTRATTPTIITPGTVHHARFASKLALIVYRLEDLKFSMSQIEQVLCALNYSLTSTEVALDWLCLHLPSTELPPLFTEYLVRDKQNQTRNQHNENSLTVVKFKAPTTTASPNMFAADMSEGGEGDIDHVLSERLLLLQQPNESSFLEQSTKSKEEQDEAKAHKAWVLAQYQYEDNDYEMHQGTVMVNFQQSGKDAKLTKQQITSKDKSCKIVAPPTIATNEPPPPQQQPPTITPSDPVDESDLLPPSPQELQLLELERELDEADADLKNDVNNYMRSKQETKELAIHVKKLKQQVGGLRKRVEKQKEKQSISVVKPEPVAVAESGDKQSREHEEDCETGGLFSTEKEEDEDEEYGGGIFDRTAAGAGKNDSSATSTPTTNGIMANGVDVSALAITPPPLKNVDYSIPKGWTGTTPQKTLNEWYQKRQKGKATKLPKPKYHKLPGCASGGNNKKQQGYRLVIVTEKGESREFLQEQIITLAFRAMCKSI
jgi:hypothetical protein